MTSLERKVPHVTSTSPRPALFACFSTIFWSSMIMNWMYPSPYCFAMRMVFASA
jgi:hypothetical protein